MDEFFTFLLFSSSKKCIQDCKSAKYLISRFPRLFLLFIPASAFSVQVFKVKQCITTNKGISYINDFFSQMFTDRLTVNKTVVICRTCNLAVLFVGRMTELCFTPYDLRSHNQLSLSLWRSLRYNSTYNNNNSTRINQYQRRY